MDPVKLILIFKGMVFEFYLKSMKLKIKYNKIYNSFNKPKFLNPPKKVLNQSNMMNI